MFKFALTMVIMTALIMGPALAGNWVAVDESARAPKLPSIEVVRSDTSGTIIEVRVPGFLRDEVSANGTETVSVTIPGVSVDMVNGMPELPKLTGFLRLPNDTGVVAKIISSEEAAVKLEADVLPSRGHILRNVNPQDVPYTFGAPYHEGGWYPASDEAVGCGEPFILRDVRGFGFTFRPFSYNSAEKTLKVITRARILFANVAGGTNVRKATRRPSGSSDFSNIYGNVFLNWAPDSAYVQKDEVGKLVIIAHESFLEAAKPLAVWKKKAGYDTELVNFSDVGTTAADLKAFIADKYAKGAVFFVLIGDTPQIPTLRGLQEGAASDPCFVKIEGSDNVPDAFISRLSGLKVEDIENQVSKIVAYESKPMTGADAAWYGKAMGIASGEGNPTDYERCDELNESLKNYTYTSVDELYDKSSGRPTPAHVIAGVNEGRGVINYIGHGSATSWVTSRFSNSDIEKLDNGMKLPVIWSVACVNGKFEGTYDCFAERWMKTGSKDAPRGAAAIFAASTNAAWVPPCDMQGEIIHNLLCKEQKLTVGGQAVNGVLKGMEIWGTDDKSQGNQLNEQYNIFGDCSMLVRTRKPAAVKVSLGKDDGATTFSVSSENRAVSGARVAVYSEDMNTWSSAITGENGTARLEVEGPGLRYTVTGFNLIPIVDAEVK